MKPLINLQILPVSSSSTLYFGLLVFCLLLGVGLIIGAWRRPRHRQRWARIAAGGAAAAALWFTAFPPTRAVPAARTEAILLTEGYAPDTLRRLRQQLGAGTPVWFYGAGNAPTRTRPLGNLLDLAEQRPALRRLHVLGAGLPAAELPLLGPLAVQWHSGPAFSGIATAYWPHKLALGEVLRLEGTVAAGPGPAWVSLRAAGAGRDSVQILKTGGAFRLRYQPKTTGLAQYELLLRRPGQAPAAEPVPVEITTSSLPAVLLLAATPSFEFKFLKNYLGEAHYPVALRTTVSRGLAQTDFVNQPARPLGRLTPGLLARYAVLVLDAGTLEALAGAEAQAVQAAVRAGRLGLLVLADAAPLPRATPGRADFTIIARATVPAPPQALTWPEAPADVRAVLPAQLRPAPALRALITGPQRAVLAASRRVGLGAVVVSVVPETFRWALQGRAPVYAGYWTRLLAAAVPPAPSVAVWRVGTRWPRPHQSLTLHLAAGVLPAARPTAQALAGGPPVPVALRQDPRLPEWSTAQFWPRGPGWHTARGPGPTAHHFYVYPTTAWPGPERQERQQAVAQRPIQAAASATRTMVAQPWPTGWFFALFLVAAGYLWLEEKL